MMEGEICASQVVRAAIPSHFLSSIQHSFCMNKLCIFVGTSVVGWLGWWLGEVLGFGFGWCFVLSGIGSVVGVWVGWKVARKFE